MQMGSITESRGREANVMFVAVPLVIFPFSLCSDCSEVGNGRVL